MSVKMREQKNKKGFVADLIPRLVCLFLAIIIWLYVVFNNAPDYEKSFEGIVVEPVNVRVLDEYNLTVSEDIIATVNVVIYGNRGDISAYSASDIKATIDFIGVDEAGVQSLPITLELPDGATVKNYSPRSIDVNIQEIGTDTVTLVPKPRFASKYPYEVACFDNLGNEITEVSISGPKSMVKLVDHVEAAPICEEPLSTTTTIANVELIACTKDGTPIESDYIGIYPSTATVEISLYDQKEVEMVIKPESDLLAKEIKSIDVSPEKIQVRKKIVGGRTLSGVSSVTVGVLERDKLCGSGRCDEFEFAIELDDIYENLSDFETVTVLVTYNENSEVYTKLEVVENVTVRLTGMGNERFEVLDKGVDVTVRVPNDMDLFVLNNLYLYGNIADVENGELEMKVWIPNGYEDRIFPVGEYVVKVKEARGE